MSQTLFISRIVIVLVGTTTLKMFPGLENLSGSGATPTGRWPRLVPRRANDSADEMIRSLVKDVKNIQERLLRTEVYVQQLLELRARDHSAREDAFAGRFVAMGGTFADDNKSVYDVDVGSLDDKLVTQNRANVTWLATVRFTKPIMGGRVNYDGRVIDVVADFENYAQDAYEIKRVARRYMLEHTGWQPMFPSGKNPDSVAPYALF